MIAFTKEAAHEKTSQDVTDFYWWLYDINCCFQCRNKNKANGAGKGRNNKPGNI